LEWQDWVQPFVRTTGWLARSPALLVEDLLPWTRKANWQSEILTHAA
jgi:hypothetical protein